MVSMRIRCRPSVSPDRSGARGGSALLRRAVLILLLGGLGWPTGVQAQSAADSARAVHADSLSGRRAALRAARAERTEHRRSPQRAPLERFFLWVEEQRLLQQLTGAVGRKVRVLPGGLGRGSGVALRVAYVPFLERSDLDVRLSAGGSGLGYWLLEGSVGLRREDWFGYAYTRLQHRPETTYLAAQATPTLASEHTFDYTNWVSGGVLGLRPHPALAIAASASYLRQAAAADESALQPADPRILNPGTSTRYLSVGGHLTLDLRDVQYERNFGVRYLPLTDNFTDRPLNPDAGTLLSLDARRFVEQGGPDANFTQVEIEAQQYVSFLNGYYTFALRHRSVFTDRDEGDAVPFYHLPYVGGNFTLRGYDEFRFQGPSHALLYNLEYRYKVWHHADAVLFGDAGKVFEDAGAWGLTDLRYSYGAGVRFVTPRRTLLRFGVAFDEDRSARLIFEFSNVF